MQALLNLANVNSTLSYSHSMTQCMGHLGWSASLGKQPESYGTMVDVNLNKLLQNIAREHNNGLKF